MYVLQEADACKESWYVVLIYKNNWYINSRQQVPSFRFIFTFFTIFLPQISSATFSIATLSFLSTQLSDGDLSFIKTNVGLHR